MQSTRQKASRERLRPYSISQPCSQALKNCISLSFPSVKTWRHSVMDWKATFNKMGQRINEIAEYATNYGGCCVVAGLVGKALEEKGIRVIGGAVHAGGWFST